MPVLSAKNRRLMFCDRIDRNERGLNQFGRQKIERDICIDRQTAKPPSELMDHQASGDCCRVTCTFRSAGADLGVRLIKQSRGIMLSLARLGNRQYADNLAQHPTVDPDVAAAFDTAPDGGSARYAVDAAKHRVAGRLLCTE